MQEETSLEYREWLKIWKELRFMQLFVFSLFALLMQAYFYRAPLVLFLVSLLYLNVIYVAFSVTGANKKILYVLFFVWIFIVATRHIFIEAHWAMFLISEILSMLLLLVSITHIFKYVLFSRRVTTDTLFASMVNYLLIAILFARVYATIDYMAPHSFSYSDDLLNADGSLLSTHFSYFSLVTIATLGYGDIVPLHPMAQMLAAIEAVIGQFYVAMVVAWLVSMHVMHNSGKHHS